MSDYPQYNEACANCGVPADLHKGPGDEPSGAPHTFWGDVDSCRNFQRCNPPHAAYGSLAAEPAAAAWGCKRPLQAGDYWFQGGPSEAPQIVTVKLLTFPDEGVGRWFAWSQLWSQGRPLSDMEGRWAGPLVPPNPFTEWEARG